MIAERNAKLRRSAEEKLRDLLTDCYAEVAPNDVDIHFDRLRSAEIPDQVFNTPSILNADSIGIKFADLFCGAGGLSIGFELQGAECVTALDHDEASLATYRFNRSTDAKVLHQGIDELLHDDANVEACELLIGGPPCQGFSLANQQPTANDPRNRLYVDFLEYAERCKSQVILIENVPGILKHWKAIHDDLVSRGFMSQVYELDAADLGAPQNRKRVFIVGVRGIDLLRADRFLETIREVLDIERAASRRSVLRDALHGLPRLVAKSISNATYLENDDFGYTVAPSVCDSNAYLDRINEGFLKGLLFNHRTKYNNERDIALFKSLRQGEDTRAESFAALNPYGNRDHMFKDKFYRLDEDKRSKTITAHMYYDCHMYIHPRQDRGLTPREAARVQGFPDQYVFLGKPNEWYRQIGNAVSPIVSKSLAKAIFTSMQSYL